MERPLGPAFVVGAVRGVVAAIVPALLSIACCGPLIVRPDPMNNVSVTKPENLLVVFAFLITIGAGLGIGDAVSARLEGWRARVALHVAAFAAVLAAFGETEALSAHFAGNPVWGMAPNVATSEAVLALVVAACVGVGPAVLGPAVKGAPFGARLGRGVGAALESAIALWFAAVVATAPKILETPAAIPSFLLACGVPCVAYAVLFVVGAHFSRPVAWRVRRWIEPDAEAPAPEPAPEEPAPPS